MSRFPFAICLVFLAVTFVVAPGSPAVHAAPSAAAPLDVAQMSIQENGPDQSDDDVVEVQLVVLGIVIGTVFVLGTGAFLLRRRLGLTTYEPPANTGHH
jgi:hypothetical protein